MKTPTLGILILAACLGAGILSAAAPAGWFLAGSKPANYETGVDQFAAYKGMPSAYLKAKADSEGFGSLLQGFLATNYLGKRIRLSGFVKSENVKRKAGLWMRIDGEGNPPRVLGFDNMQNRPIAGTTDWQRYEVVLDVPESAVAIALGILLDGPGEIWLNGTNVEVVPTSVPVTRSAGQAPTAPQNLSFTQ